MTRSTDERRRHPRIPLRGGLQILYQGRFLRRPRSVDLSEGGMRIAGVTLPPQASLKLLLALPDDRLHCLRGEVVWTRGEGVGVRFVDPPASSLKQLRRQLRTTA
jgi:hypothetical protein